MPDDLGNLASFDPQVITKLLPWRQLILEVAAGTPGVGAISESLKWGEPSYTPQKKGIGSSVRLALCRDGNVALNFICHTGLVDSFRELYTGTLQFEGRRTIVIGPELDVHVDELRHCIAMALTFLQNPTLLPQVRDRKSRT